MSPSLCRRGSRQGARPTHVSFRFWGCLRHRRRLSRCRACRLQELRNPSCFVPIGFQSLSDLFLCLSRCPKASDVVLGRSVACTALCLFGGHGRPGTSSTLADANREPKTAAGRHFEPSNMSDVNKSSNLTECRQDFELHKIPHCHCHNSVH